jgi:hypothetical protein
LPSRLRPCRRSSAMRDHSRNSTTAGSSGSRRRRQRGSVLSARAGTAASRLSSLAQADETRSRKRSELPGVDGVDGKATLHQPRDDRTMRHCDGHGDLRRRRSRVRAERVPIRAVISAMPSPP